ncbi:hypothetical protein [Chitinibacter sp. S2-10]|uniref:hypothetical protein n=1 Tax=Chitinibacter sp. S2-10 TaxID=3373597 RepID=UPI0039774EBD
MHAVNLLALWLWLLCGLPWLERLSLLGLMLIILLLAYYFARQRLRKSLPRMRWLLLAVLGVYAWATPGLYLFPLWFSPTIEGLFLGFDQVLRLLIVMGSLQIMLTHLDKGDIVSGLYYFSRPMGLFGVSARLVALRLTLTMEFAERFLEKRLDFRTLLGDLLHVGSEEFTGMHVRIVKMSGLQLVLFMVQLLLIVFTIAC